MNQRTFDVEHFLSISNEELVAYIEPFLISEEWKIDDDQARKIEGAFPTLDKFQTVYALELCMRADAVRFIPNAIECLSHRDAEICCAASNSIDRFWSTNCTVDIVALLVSVPEVELFTTHVVTGNIESMGTNEKFVRPLIDRFTREKSNR
jgi:hypothetical protein